MPLLDLPNDILLVLFSHLPDPQTYRSLVLASSRLGAIGTYHRPYIFRSIAENLYDPALISLVYKHQTLSAYQALLIQRASHRIHLSEGVIYAHDNSLGRKKEWTADEFLLAETLDTNMEELVIKLLNYMFYRIGEVPLPTVEARLKRALFNLAGLMCGFHLNTRLEDLPDLSGDDEWKEKTRDDLMRLAIMADDLLVEWDYDYSMWMEMGVREMAEVLGLGRFLGLVDWEGIDMVREWADIANDPMGEHQSPLSTMAEAHLKRVFMIKVLPKGMEELHIHKAMHLLWDLIKDPFGCKCQEKHFEEALVEVGKWDKASDPAQKKKYLDIMFEKKEVDQWNAYEGRYERKEILALRSGDDEHENGWDRIDLLDARMLHVLVTVTDKTEFWNGWREGGLESSDESSDSDEDDSDSSDSDEEDSDLSDSEEDNTDSEDLHWGPPVAFPNFDNSEGSSSDENSSSSSDDSVEESSSDDSDSAEVSEEELVWQG